MGGMGRWSRRAGAAVALVCLLAGSLVATSASVGGAQSGSQNLTIPLGSIMPVDAPEISFKDNKEALEATIAGFNKRNKNVQFTLFFCDGKHNPNTDADCARQMVSKGVVATVGDIASANPAAVDQILTEAGIPRVGLSMIGLPEFSSPVSYPLSTGPMLASAGALEQFKTQGIDKISIIIQQSPQASAIQGLLTPASKTVGVEIVNTVQTPIGTTDYTSYISAAQANGAEGMLCVCTPQTGNPIATAAAQLGSTLPLFNIVLGFSLDEMLETGYEDWVLTDSFPTPEKVNVKAFPNLKQFLADMKAAKSADLAPGKLKGSMEQGWLAVHAIAQVTEGMTEVTAASLKSALDTAQDIDMLGIIPPWTPSNPGPGLFSRVSNPYMYRITWKGNKMITSAKEPIDAAAIFSG